MIGSVADNAHDERSEGSLMLFAGKAYSAAWHKKQNSANNLELGHALNIYQSLMYEPDDRVLYSMLQNFRDNWMMYYGISVWGRSGMIKPDYTFFHHGELSYWGNITGYTRIGEVYANSLLDFEPETHRTIANHLSRYAFGALPLFVASTNKRVNLMFQKNSEGQIVLSVCDPEIAFSEGKYGGQVADQISATREVRIVFDQKLQLVSSHSGLPEANPPLEARVEEAVGTSTLRFQTSNAVTDTFVLARQEESVRNLVPQPPRMSPRPTRCP